MAEKHHSDRKRARAWLSAAGWPALLLVICIGFFWKLVLSDQFTWLDSPDFAYQVLPWYQFQASEWHHGRIPLWDPNLWGGQPLLAQGQPGAAYPPNWLLFLAPLRNGWIRQGYLHWYFVLIHFQAALFCYWLCRDLKRTQGASLLSGLAFGLSGFIGANDWPQMLNGAVWAPIVLLFFLRAMRGERPIASAAWSGGLLGVAFLSGHHQIPIFIGLAMAGAWIYYLAADRKRWKLLLVFGVFLALVSALQVLPALEYGKLALRWVGAENPVGWKDTVPYVVHKRLSLYPESILGLVIPGIMRNADPFIGLVAFSLALLGLAGNWRDRTPRLFGAIALGGLLFSLGPNSVFHGIVYALVPMVEKARNASMAIFICHFGLCVLIAYGIDGYRTLDSGFLKRATWILFGFAASIGVLTLVFLIAKRPADDRLGMVVLVGFLLAAILGAWRADQISTRAAISALVLLMLLEAGNVTTYGLRSQAEAKLLVKELTEHSDIATFLRSQEGPVRAEVEEKDIPYNFGDWYGIGQMSGYLASITTNVTLVQANTRARMMYAANFNVARQPSRPDQVEVFTGQSGVKVYRNPAAFPRVWTVHEAFAIERDDQISSQLENPEFDARRQAFVKGRAPELQTCQGPETVTRQEPAPGRVVIETDLKCRGMVIDADTFYPGWQATVDGKDTPVYEAYGFLRGVVVEAGSHRIEMRYRPKSVYWGGALTLLGLLGAVWLRTRVE